MSASFANAASPEPPLSAGAVLPRYRRTTWRALMSCSLQPGGMLATGELDGAALAAGVGDMFMPADGDGAALAAAEAAGAGLPLGRGLDVAYSHAWLAPGVQAATVAATRPVPASAAPRRKPRRVTAASTIPAGSLASATGRDGIRGSWGVTVSMGRHGTRPERGFDGTFVTIGRVPGAKYMRMRARCWPARLVRPAQSCGPSCRRRRFGPPGPARPGPGRRGPGRRGPVRPPPGALVPIRCACREPYGGSVVAATRADGIPSGHGAHQGGRTRSNDAPDEHVTECAASAGARDGVGSRPTRPTVRHTSI